MIPLALALGVGPAGRLLYLIYALLPNVFTVFLEKVFLCLPRYLCTSKHLAFERTVLRSMLFFPLVLFACVIPLVFLFCPYAPIHATQEAMLGALTTCLNMPIPVATRLLTMLDMQHFRPVAFAKGWSPKRYDVAGRNMPWVYDFMFRNAAILGCPRYRHAGPIHDETLVEQVLHVVMVARAVLLIVGVALSCSRRRRWLRGVGAILGLVDLPACALTFLLEEERRALEVIYPVTLGQALVGTGALVTTLYCTIAPSH
jgi:hypothetical protein